ncbi:hypothetical protein [Ruegeria arenilitoris]|uniref:hypothetical protein n=1 Tax=Ruegeria arenilitoris TaxID=1173585 RepID=UPI00147C6788|nr:hypothetical protein [Ruegeria arenilitoris]
MKKLIDQFNVLSIKHPVRARRAAALFSSSPAKAGTLITSNVADIAIRFFMSFLLSSQMGDNRRRFVEIRQTDDFSCFGMEKHGQLALRQNLQLLQKT